MPDIGPYDIEYEYPVERLRNALAGLEAAYWELVKDNERLRAWRHCSRRLRLPLCCHLTTPRSRESRAGDGTRTRDNRFTRAPTWRSTSFWTLIRTLGTCGLVCTGFSTGLRALPFLFPLTLCYRP